MKNLIIVLYLLVITITSCNQNNVEKGTPKCLKKEINKKFDKNSSDNARVMEYLFQNKTVYVFNDGKQMPDGTSEVLDENCNNIGFLGGLGGNRTINGVDFSTAVFVKTVWKK